MIELIALLVSVVSISWARKADISRIISDDRSLAQIQHSLRNPQLLYLRYIAATRRCLSRYIQYREKCFFALFFLSTALVSFLYSLSWSFFGSHALLGPSDDVTVAQWAKEALFFLLLFLSLLCYVLNKYGCEFEHLILSRRSHAVLVLVRVCAAALLCASLYYTTRSYILCIVVLLISLGCAVAPACIYKEQRQLQGSATRLGLAAAFGPSALLSVTYSILAAGQQLEVPAAIVAALTLVTFAAASGLSAYTGREKTPTGNYYSLPPWTKAASSMGIHIIDCFAGFATAVAIAGFFPAVLAAHGVTTPSISAGVLLTCAIFAAGARTLAGSGAVIFVVITLTSILFFASNREVPALPWIESLLFWIALPLLNSSFNFITVSVTRYFLALIARTKRIVPFFFMADLVISFFLLAIQISALTLVLLLLNTEIDIGIDIGSVISMFVADPFGEAMWLTFMLLVTLAPTVLHSLILLLGGVAQFAPAIWRNSVDRNIDRAATQEGGLSRYQTDILCWRLTVFDPLSGAVLFAALAVITAMVLDTSTGTIGKAIVNWSFVSLDLLGTNRYFAMFVAVISTSPIFFCIVYILRLSVKWRGWYLSK